MLNWGRKNKLLVLCYHNVAPPTHARFLETRALTVTPSQFDSQIKILSRVLNFISPAELLNTDLKEMPARPALLTFDDGTKGLIRHAVPVLNNYGVKALCFTALEHHQNPLVPYWWDLADPAFDESAESSDFISYLEKLKQSGVDQNRRNATLQSHHPEVSADLTPMSESELKAWVSQGHFLASHANRHDPYTLWQDEEATSPDALKKLAGDGFLPFLAFPYGDTPRLPEQKERIYSLLQKQQFEAAFSTEGRLSPWPQSITIDEALPRLVVPSQWSTPRLLAKLTGLALAG